MGSTLPLLIGAGAGAYLLLRKKKTPGPNVVITPIKASPPSAYQMPPTASPTDLAPPKEEIVDIQGLGAASDSASTKLKTLSATVLQYQAVAASKCPNLVGSYKDLANDIVYQMTLDDAGQGDASYVATLEAQLKQLNSTCASKGTATVAPAAPPSAGGGVLPLFAVAGIFAYLALS